jgi:Zn-dependent peptidase ImmA (M78 family)/transcriptional regulator with XRE-family HTH domain
LADLHQALARARERAHYSQDEVAAVIGVSRAMLSYWETAARVPNDRQVAALARLYGVEPADLLEDRDAEPAGGDLARLLLRAEEAVDPEAVPGMRDFLRFLDAYAELASLANAQVRGLSQSPFVHRAKFAQKDDARRKAEEARNHLRLGTGPIGDVDSVGEMLGITVYRAPLGGDLNRVPSGAFVKHPLVGFAILVNLDMTPGRRRFTAAHEIAHALFHSDDTAYVVSRGRGPVETFADEFAGEFLMPSEGVRRFMEEAGMSPRLTDPVDAIHIQRYFRVSFPTTLVRLRQMNAITGPTYVAFKNEVRPVALARALGYSPDPEEYEQDADLWRIQRFPRAFLRMLRDAVVHGLLSPPSAASFAGLSLPDLVNILGQPTADGSEPDTLGTEFHEFEVTGVV